MGTVSEGTSGVDRIVVERIGGFAGAGLPGSRIRSRAEVEWTELSAGERRAIERLFAGGRGASRPAPDAFRCRITRRTTTGTRTIEVQEDEVPRAIRDRIHDTLD